MNKPKGLILWVESRLSKFHPSSRSLLESLEILKENHWRIEGVAFEFDEGLGLERVHQVPRLRLPRGLNVFGDMWAMNRWLMKNLPTLRAESENPVLVHSNASLTFYGDIVSFHFDNTHCNEIQRELMGFESWQERAITVLRSLVAVVEKRVLASPRPQRILTVSRALAESLARITPPQRRSRIVVLPNCYDSARFRPEVRSQFYNAMREDLGFTPGDFVFGCGALGHFRRKGFWLASRIVEKLQRAQLPCPVRLLVIGGQEATLEKLRSGLDQRHPGWQDWLTFTGFVPEMEKYLAACDALLSPSYYEAFSLVEIEAGALGLPLVVTDHPGTEMILRDQQNGLKIDFDPDLAASLIEAFGLEKLRQLTGDPGEALNQAQYAHRLTQLYNTVADEIKTKTLTKP